MTTALSQNNSPVLQPPRVVRERLTYFLPNICKLSCDLISESALLYRELSAKKAIARFKASPHLGAISKVYESARHTKWDYIFLCLYIFQRAKESTSDLGLNSRIALSPKIEEMSSGVELLKSWIFLLSAGHLYGTFVSERCLLSALIENKELQTKFLSLFAIDPEVRSYVHEIIETQQVYRIHHALAFLYIKTDLTKEEPVSQNVWWQALKAYCLDRNDLQSLTRLRRAFGNLRRLAYLMLDLENTPMPVVLNIPVLMSQLDEYVPYLIEQINHPIVNSLTHFDNFIVEEVYLSTELTKFHNRVHDVWVKRFSDEVQKQTKKQVIDAFREEIQCQRAALGKIPSNSQDWHHFARLILGDLETTSGVRKWITLENEINSQLISTQFRVTIWSGANGKHVFLDIFSNEAKKGLSQQHSLTTLLNVFFELEARFIEFKNFNDWQNLVRSNKNVMKGFLDFFGKGYWEFNFLRRQTNIKVPSVVFARNRRAAKSFLKNAIALSKDAKSSRVHELEMALCFLEEQTGKRHKDGKYILALESVLFTTKSTQSGEVDGVIVQAIGDELVVWLIEAKDQKSRSNSAARRALETKFMKLIPNNDPNNIVSMNKFAYAQLSPKLPLKKLMNVGLTVPN